MVALSYSKPASASRDGCGAQDSDERNTLCIAGLFPLIFIFTHMADGGFME